MCLDQGFCKEKENENGKGRWSNGLEQLDHLTFPFPFTFPSPNPGSTLIFLLPFLREFTKISFVHTERDCKGQLCAERAD